VNDTDMEKSGYSSGNQQFPFIDSILLFLHERVIPHGSDTRNLFDVAFFFVFLVLLYYAAIVAFKMMYHVVSIIEGLFSYSLRLACCLVILLVLFPNTHDIKKMIPDGTLPSVYIGKQPQPQSPSSFLEILYSMKIEPKQQQSSRQSNMTFLDKTLLYYNNMISQGTLFPTLVMKEEEDNDNKKIDYSKGWDAYS
jgi:hypothetical protein